MKAPGRILILEDDSCYAELLSFKLRAEWPECGLRMVGNEADFKAAIGREAFDLIISDYSMPHFNGLEALAFVRENHPGIPFVIVSGNINDELAVESLKAGATDYVLKDRAARLVPAIRRALQDVEINRRRNQAELAHQESEALKSSIMDASLDCIIIVDEHGRILEFNPTAVTTFGYGRAEIAGQLLVEKIIPPGSREPIREAMFQCLEHGDGSLFGRRTEATGMRADGSEFPMEWAIVPLNLMGRHVFTAYLRDITDAKMAQEKVRQVQAKLEESNRDLKRRNEEIQNFYHTLSHELKTPLTSMREFVSMVMDNVAGPVNPRQMEYLAIAKKSCDQMRMCINDLFDASRLETGKLALEFKPVLPSVLLKGVVASLAPKAAEKGVAILDEIEPDLARAVLDEHRIVQVVTNLVNNAINHTPANGEICVRAHVAPSQPEWLQVSVEDTGCGIDPEQQERIFDRLYQVKTGDATKGGGLGLGLYLCRELVQAHGGSVWVQSAPGKGSTFSFALPFDQEMLKLNVLVMDDDEALLEVTREFLQMEYAVRTSRDGVEGLKEMQRHAPDAVLLDLSMPNLDGPGILREIRKTWGTSIPIIVYTAYSTTALMKQAMNYSPFTLLSKPCQGPQILETVRKALRTSNTTIWNRKQRVAQQALEI
jgi:PAS domain S-box-containing protein